MEKLLKLLAEVRVSEFVFPGSKRNSPLSNMAFLALRDRMNYSHITVHGFRSTFKDWAAQEKNCPDMISELCLAHQVGSDVARAYRRGGLLQKRRELMELWGEYLHGQN